jgi:rhombotail lipoprotein
VRHGNTTLIDADQETRDAGVQSFSAATDQMIERFDVALTQFEAQVRAGKANVRVVHKSNTAAAGGGSGGGGALNWTWVTLLTCVVVIRAAGMFSSSVRRS